MGHQVGRQDVVPGEMRGPQTRTVVVLGDDVVPGVKSEPPRQLRDVAHTPGHVALAHAGWLRGQQPPRDRQVTLRGTADTVADRVVGAAELPRSLAHRGDQLAVGRGGLVDGGGLLDQGSEPPQPTGIRLTGEPPERGDERVAVGRTALPGHVWGNRGRGGTGRVDAACVTAVLGGQGGHSIAHQAAPTLGVSARIGSAGVGQVGQVTNRTGRRSPEAPASGRPHPRRRAPARRS